ncbi:MAG: hypothetical protein QXQ53_04470 [Candidatus Methanosuratincola sp.]
MKGVLIEPNKIRIQTNNVADALELVTMLAYMPLTYARISIDNSNRYILLRRYQNAEVTIDVTFDPEDH